MRLSPSVIPVLLALCVAAPQVADCQVLAAAAAMGPAFLPGSGTLGDWHGMISIGVQRKAIGARMEAMYTGVPGADLLALTGNVLWVIRPGVVGEVEPYVIGGAGSYVKFSETRFGLNAGAGVRRQAGPLRLFAEVRYHRVTSRFDEARDADTFVPVSVGVALWHGR